MLTEDQIQAIFDDLETMRVVLPPNADTLGPVFLQNKILELRTHIGRAEVHLMNVLKVRRIIQSRLSLSETEMELKFQDLMTNNLDVTRAPSAKDRENKAKYLLSDLYRSILETKAALSDLANVEIMVKNKLKELKELSAEIKLHRSLLRDSLDTGSFYGSEGAGSAPQSARRPAATERDLLPAGVSLDPTRQRDLDGFLLPSVTPVPPDEGEEELLRELRGGARSVNTDS